MSRIHAAALAVAFTALALPAFATNDVPLINTGSAGAYPATPGAKTREAVKAELAAAIKDGSFAMTIHNRSSSPNYASRPIARGQEPANLVQNLKSGGEITFEAPAAGGRTRAQVLQELQRAREDGSLRRMNTNRGY